MALRNERRRFDYGRMQKLSTALCNVHTETNRVIVLLAGTSGLRLEDARLGKAAITAERVAILRRADFVVRSAMEEKGLTDAVWQFPVVLAPISFGSIDKGDKRASRASARAVFDPFQNNFSAHPEALEGCVPRRSTVPFGGGESVVLRPVNSEDGMTANFARLPLQFLRRVAEKIASTTGVDAVFLDITNKPPATIEWE